MKRRRFTYDLPLDQRRAPQAGDLIHHHSAINRVESWWRIVDARPVESKLWGNRWSLGMVRLLAPPTSTDRHVWQSWAYAKGEKPGDRS